MRSIVEQMVRHVQNFEQTELATRLNASLAGHDHVTARLLFINVLDWLRARGTHGWKNPMRLPDCPWAAKLKEMIQIHPALSEVFQIRNDQLNFNPSLPPEDVRWAESYVAENYRPVAMR